jgi:tyrosyl-tRNA synthetase
MDKNYNILITRGISEIFGKDELLKKLNLGKKIRVKFGVDPTSPDLHLGHSVCFHKLREFQELGHKIILIIGDFTARIGDPTGRSVTRNWLTKKEVDSNLKSYLDQLSKIVDIKKTEVRYNSEWYDKSKADFIMELGMKVTIARILERDDFQKRLKAGQDISFQETTYPLLQAYDSVVINSDIEIGGTDQKFNMLMGRDIQRKYNQLPQSVMTMPLLIGLDGEKKMSKSYNNYIGISESPDIQFGKIMSIPDSLIPQYFELAARVAGKELEKIKKEASDSSKCRELKATLAREIVSFYHGMQESLNAQEDFNRVFRDKENPLNIHEVKVKKSTCDDLPQLLLDLKLVSSKGDARRLMEQGGVRVDKAQITDPKASLCMHNGMVLQVGKLKFVKIRL